LRPPQELPRVPPEPSRSGKPPLLTFIVLSAAAFVAGAAGMWFYAANPAVAAKRAAGKPADLSDEAVVALGRIRPNGGLRAIVGPPGDQIAELLVKEGDTVHAGQPLVRLVSRADRKAELDMLDQQIVSADAQTRLAKATGEADILVAQSKLDEQKQLAPLDLKAQRAKLDLLDKQKASAEQRLRSMRELRQVSPNTVSTQDLDGQELLVAQADAEIEAGKALLAKAELAQQTGAKVAEAQLAAARANLQSKLREIPLDSLKQKRELAKLQYDRTQLLAPTSGTVVKVTGRAGDPTAAQQSVLDLADTATMQVVAEVYETDVAKLRKWGRTKARVTSRALPNDLSGEVAGIGTVIARNQTFDVDPTADTDRRVFEVTIDVSKSADAAVAAQFLNLQVQVFFEPSK
jgi:HlyD family secretion protein